MEDSSLEWLAENILPKVQDVHSGKIVPYQPTRSELEREMGAPGKELLKEFGLGMVTVGSCFAIVTAASKVGGYIGKGMHVIGDVGVSAGIAVVGYEALKLALKAGMEHREENAARKEMSKPDLSFYNTASGHLAKSGI